MIPFLVATAALSLKLPAILAAGYTGSMLPAIRGGDLLSVTACEVRDVQKGMIVLTWRVGLGAFVPHRVIGKRWGGTVLVTKGDNNRTRDAVLTDKDNLCGCITVISKH